MPEWLNYIRVFFDIGIVTFLFYKIVMMVKDTRAIAIVKGLVLVLALWGGSKLLHFTTLEYVISQVLLYGVLGIMILFQPELRTALEKLGNNKWDKWGNPNQTVFSSKQILINDLVEASTTMSATKTGALICIEMNDSLQEYMDTGIELDAKVSSHLLGNVFFPNAPLHDGALFIRGNRITHTSGYLPLSDRTDIPKELGTRHRASLGLAETTDAIVIVVSEETGKISLIHHDNLLRPLDKDTLRAELDKRLITEEDKKHSNTGRGKRKKRVKIPK